MSAAAEAGVSALDPDRVLANLRSLANATGGPDGAQRLAWTPVWLEARELFKSFVTEAGLEVEPDRSGNLWTTLEGESDEVVVLGSHLDSVPNGGWLDGALGVMAGLEVLRAFREDGVRPPKTLALVDWADEEGARFGRSLVGSSAFTGTLSRDELEHLTDAEGERAADVLSAHGVDIGTFGDPDPRLARVAAYLELHIEQGPILEAAGAPVAAVTGTIGIERDRFVIKGQSAHAGPTPMDMRHDAFLVAASTALQADRCAVERGGRATCGRLDLSPGIPTAVNGVAELYVDLRHDDATTLATMRSELQREAVREASVRGCTVERQRVWNIDPRPFDDWLVARAKEACVAAGGTELSLPSGALHDAGELAPLVPTAMVFCSSRRGLSHSPEEDSNEEDLITSIHAFGGLARAALNH